MGGNAELPIFLAVVLMPSRAARNPVKALLCNTGKKKKQRPARRVLLSTRESFLGYFFLFPLTCRAWFAAAAFPAGVCRFIESARSAPDDLTPFPLVIVGHAGARVYVSTLGVGRPGRREHRNREMGAYGAFRQGSGKARRVGKVPQGRGRDSGGPPC